MHATTKIRQDFIGHLIRITKDAEVYGIVIVVAKTKPILGTMALSKSTTDGTMKVAAKQARKPEGARFVRYFGPLLDALRALGGSGTPDEVVERIAQDLRLSDDVQNELLPSGEPRYRNQVAWARFYLVREGLLDSSKRGVWSLTERGRATTLTRSNQAKSSSGGSGSSKTSDALSQLAQTQLRSRWLRVQRQQPATTGVQLSNCSSACRPSALND
jgi:hypothetical protein